MKTKSCLILLIAVLFTSCGSPSNSMPITTSTATNSDTLTPFDLQDISSAVSANISFVDVPLMTQTIVQGQKNLSLFIYGLYAIDEEKVFLFGNVTYRSILLRSGDGGKTWQESAMFEEKCYPCTISHVMFIGNGEGWASMEEEGEGGEMYLWHTLDYGVTWEKIIEMPRGIATIEGIEFIDAKHGRMIQTVFRRGKTLDGVSILTTSDGGYNWDISFERSFPVNLDSQSQIKLLSAYLPIEKGGYFGNHWDSLGGSMIAAGQDGSQWDVENKFGPEIYIRKCSLGESEWAVYVLPFELKYIDGLITVP